MKDMVMVAQYVALSDRAKKAVMAVVAVILLCLVAFIVIYSIRGKHIPSLSDKTFNIIRFSYVGGALLTIGITYFVLRSYAKKDEQTKVLLANENGLFDP
jgi:hypothetical protein